MDLNLVRLSVQRALLGHVIPNLRAVTINYEQEIIKLIFYFDNSPTEDEEELASLADAEFIADFPSTEYKTDCKIITLAYPNRIPKEGICVYKRYEQ